MADTTKIGNHTFRITKTIRDLTRLEFKLDYRTCFVESRDGRSAWMCLLSLDGHVFESHTFIAEPPAEYAEMHKEWAKAEERVVTEYFSKHIRLALISAVDLIVRESKLFWPLTEEPLADALKQRWLKEIQKQVKAEAKRRLGMDSGQGKKIPRTRRFNLDLEYRELLKTFQAIKRHHNRELRRFEESRGRNGYTRGEWSETWVSYARKVYPTFSDDLLNLFSDEDPFNSLPSKIAYKHLAKDTGYSSSDYIEKLVKKLRRDRDD